jgi:glycerol-3-phosphate cytidylyltransferase
LRDLLLILPIDVRILGVEYEGREFSGEAEGYTRGIKPIFNRRDHSFSSSGLRSRVVEAESMKLLKGK